MKQRSILGGLVCVLVMGVFPMAAQQYNLTDIGMPDSYYQFGIPRWGGPSEVYDINNAGVLVGEMFVYDNTQSSSGHMHAFVWNQGVLQDLGTLAGETTSVARGINESGTIVGTSGSQAAVWQGGSGSALGTLGGSWSAGYGINNFGHVVGQSETALGESHAFLFSNNTMLDLGTLGGATSIAYGINSAGMIVGQSATVSGELHAFLWNSGVMTDLGTLGGPTSGAYAINEAGQITGYADSSTPSQWRHAFLWENGMMTDVTPGNFTIGSGFGLGEDGTIVGRIGSPGRAGNALKTPSPPGDEWFSALSSRSFNSIFYGINDSGQIVGSGYVQTSLGYGNRGLLLTPIPEPSSIILLIVGAAVVTLVRRRRFSL